jgi:hypothetical protein
MDDPDMVLGIDRDARDLTQDPIVRQRPGPEWIDLEAWRLGSRRSCRDQRGCDQAQPDAHASHDGHHRFAGL